MPFLRIVRDKRGYEYFSLVHTSTGRRGKARQRILYWYRTPPNIKVGRGPLDQEVMRVLEAQNPDVQFDWDALRDTPPPLPSEEPWRERRRAERAARQSRDADAEADVAGTDAELAASEPSIDAEPLENLQEAEAIMVVVEVQEISILTERAVGEPEPPGIAPEPGSGRRRRHRRRGRGNRPDGPRDGSSPPSVPAESPAAASIHGGHPESPDDNDD